MCGAYRDGLASTGVYQILLSPCAEDLRFGVVAIASRRHQPSERRLSGVPRARITKAWAGVIDVTPDAVPIIAPVGSVPGLHIATGFSGHGFGIGPGALMADLVTGSPPCVDPAPFRPERFRRLQKTA
jgi:glycine/D-amino acid oxidase-like deaminating enzyme